MKQTINKLKREIAKLDNDIELLQGRSLRAINHRKINKKISLLIKRRDQCLNQLEILK